MTERRSAARKARTRWPFYEPGAKEVHPGHVSMPTPVHDPNADLTDPLISYPERARRQRERDANDPLTVEIGHNPVIGGWPSETQESPDPPPPRVVQIVPDAPEEGSSGG